MRYEIKAIETRYAGVNFRSRLEARWAAMFDIMGWGWTYEPCDFDGWIPDFAIHGSHDLIYVEVKPVGRFPQNIANEICASGCGNECLIVGVAPVHNDYGRPALGWLSDGSPFTGSWGHWSHAMLGRWEPSLMIGFCHEEGAWVDRITGGYCADPNGDVKVCFDETVRLWREAGNRTRWEPGRSK